MRTAGVVLCGGRSSRMGAPKAWLPFGDELMLSRVVRVVGAAVGPVVVVAAPGQAVPPLPPGVRVVRDEVEGRGPLGGLAAGLAALDGEADAVYLSSCDVPLLKPVFVRRVVGMLEDPTPWPPPRPRAAETAPAGEARHAGATGGEGEKSNGASFTFSVREGSDSPSPPGGGGRGVGSAAAVPRVGDRLHPLAAAYRTAVLPVVRAMLAANHLRMTDLLARVPARVIGPHEFADIDPELLSLRNVNTPDEYELAVRLAPSSPTTDH